MELPQAPGLSPEGKLAADFAPIFALNGGVRTPFDEDGVRIRPEDRKLLDNLLRFSAAIFAGDHVVACRYSREIHKTTPNSERIMKLIREARDEPPEMRAYFSAVYLWLGLEQIHPWS